MQSFSSYSLQVRVSVAAQCIIHIKASEGRECFHLGLFSSHYHTSPQDLHIYYFSTIFHGVWFSGIVFHSQIFWGDGLRQYLWQVRWSSYMIFLDLSSTSMSNGQQLVTYFLKGTNEVVGGQQGGTREPFFFGAWQRKNLDKTFADRKGLNYICKGQNFKNARLS